jgi:hypothetical protein
MKDSAQHLVIVRHCCTKSWLEHLSPAPPDLAQGQSDVESPHQVCSHLFAVTTHSSYRLRLAWRTDAVLRRGRRLNSPAILVIRTDDEETMSDSSLILLSSLYAVTVNDGLQRPQARINATLFSNNFLEPVHETASDPLLDNHSSLPCVAIVRSRRTGNGNNNIVPFSWFTSWNPPTPTRLQPSMRESLGRRSLLQADGQYRSFVCRSQWK